MKHLANVGPHTVAGSGTPDATAPSARETIFQAQEIACICQHLKEPIMKPNQVEQIISAAVFGMAALANPAHAQTKGVAAAAASMDEIAATVGGAHVQQRISADFSAFAGSDSNAHSLVAGLRSGQPITLTSAGGAGTTTGAATAVTIMPPTRPMGYGNIYLALSLAKQRLAAQGIANPTPQQLQLALTGGTVIGGTPPKAQTVQGVLQLRSQGRSWGQIADSYGIRLGSVVGGMKSANQSLSAMTAVSSAATSGSASTTSAITTGAGMRSGAGAPAQTSAASVGANADLHGRGALSAGGADAAVDARGSMSAGGAAGVQGSSLNAIGHAANPGLVRGILR